MNISEQVGDQHPDDLAVEAFAAAMKAKMAEARAKGRGGWDDPTQCSADDLSRMLRGHVEKGDPLDVANFCMMLHQRGEAIVACSPVGQEPALFVNRWEMDHGTAPGLVAMRAGRHLGVREFFTVPLYAAPPAQAVDPADPWRGLYDPAKMPKLDGTDQYAASHPDLPEWPNEEDEERGIDLLIKAQGFAWDMVYGEYPEDDDFDVCAWLASWEPSPPAGNDWRLVLIHDTEDGPAALYVLPLALIDVEPGKANG